ncbi:tetratricopeptide repeat protein [Marinobacterium aestuariivivens]|uniref:Tetratricopeptide repeat protein n=1 Tax=Marinobacterium aestuariivivens TaxID=1698799 RepID=A0ABW1ZV49_9GAMM
MPNEASSQFSTADNLVQRAEQAEQAARYAEASLLWQQQVQKNGLPLHAHRHIDCLVQAGQLAEAASCSRTYTQRWPDRPVFVSTQLQLAYEQKAWDAMDSLWAQLADSAGERSKPVLQLIRERLQARDYPGALHAAEQAVRFWGDDEQVRLRYQQLQYRYGLDPRIDCPVQPPNLEAPELDAETAMLAIRQFADEVSNSTVIPLLQTMLQRWPDFRPAILMLLSCWQRESSYEEILVFCQRRYEAKQQLEAFSMLQWVLALSALGRIEQAVSLVREVEAQGHMANVVQHLLINTIGQGLSTNPELGAGLEALCREHGIEGLEQAVAFEAQLRPSQRPLIPSFDATQSVAASLRTCSPCMAIVFTGYARRVGAVPQALLDRFFAGHGIAMVRLVDKSGCMYLDGLPELGAVSKQL